MTDRPRLIVTLEGYAIEGGFDRPHEPSTCYRPTIALGRHAGPGGANEMWRDYERAIDQVPNLGFHGIRLGVEWARVEPRRGVVNDVALDRYVDVARYARSLGLSVTVALVDAAWPSWLGLEAWLLPWVVPHVVTHAQRVVSRFGTDATGVVVFANASSLVTKGYITALAPPWRRGATKDARSAQLQIDEILRLLHGDDVVGPKIVDATHTIGLDLSAQQIALERAGALHCDEIYVRSLLTGLGPTSAPAGLLMRARDEWIPTGAQELLSALG